MIHIYGTSQCPFCSRAKQLASQYNLTFQYFDAYQYKDKFKTLFPGETKVPQIVWNGKHIGGYDQFEKMIEESINGGGDGPI